MAVGRSGGVGHWSLVISYFSAFIGRSSLIARRSFLRGVTVMTDVLGTRTDWGPFVASMIDAAGRRGPCRSQNPACHLQFG